MALLYTTRALTVRQQPNTEATPLPYQGNHSDCPNGDLAARDRQDFSVTCRPLTPVTDRLLRWAHCQNRSESRRKRSTFTLLSDHLGTHHLLLGTQQGLHSERGKLTTSRFCLVPRAKTNRTFTSTIIPQNPGLSIATGPFFQGNRCLPHSLGMDWQIQA